MIRFETTVEIARAYDHVFDYVADAGRLAEWNLAVTTVEPLRGAPGHHVIGGSCRPASRSTRSP